MNTFSASNEEIASVLNKIANLLETQDASRFRILAYRKAAGYIYNMDESVSEIIKKKGKEELVSHPNIGESIASLITEYVKSGTSSLLQRLQGEVSPESVFKQVPGIGEDLAGNIAEELDIHSLEELETAAHDGRLEKVSGFGKRRVENVKAILAGMLSQAGRRRLAKTESDREGINPPTVPTLLEIDEEYRQKAEKGALKKIAPKRFNPNNKAWLTIMHEEWDGWNFTVLYSNTALAHDLGRTHDWVVIYFEKNGKEGQYTVVTETMGDLEGKRVVRGREDACREYYQ